MYHGAPWTTASTYAWGVISARVGGWRGGSLSGGEDPPFLSFSLVSSRAWPTRGGGKLQCKHNPYLYTCTRIPGSCVLVVRWGRWSRIAAFLPDRPTNIALFPFSFSDSCVSWQEFCREDRIEYSSSRENWDFSFLEGETMTNVARLIFEEGFGKWNVIDIMRRSLWKSGWFSGRWFSFVFDRRVRLKLKLWSWLILLPEVYLRSEIRSGLMNWK